MLFVKLEVSRYRTQSTTQSASVSKTQEDSENLYKLNIKTSDNIKLDDMKFLQSNLKFLQRYDSSDVPILK